MGLCPFGNKFLFIQKKKKIEDAMEKNMLQRAYAFGYFYKKHHKEIKLHIENRDKEMEATLN